jgi:hypothetical protein
MMLIFLLKSGPRDVDILAKFRAWRQAGVVVLHVNAAPIGHVE